MTHVMTRPWADIEARYHGGDQLRLVEQIRMSAALEKASVISSSRKLLPFTSPLRGEDGAPSLSSALKELSVCSAAELSDRGAPGGGDQFTRATFTPTRNVIGLSSPVVFGSRLVPGDLSAWRSILPPQGGGKSDGAIR